jgi:hypothetical protein
VTITTQSYMMGIGPIPVTPGEEFVKCVEVKLGNTEDVWVRRISSAIAPGSHHLIVYRLPDGAQENPQPFTCRSFEPILSGAVPLYIAQTLQNELPFPDDVALKFKAGAVIRIEAHYINANPTDTIMGSGLVEIDTVSAQAAYTEADLLFYGPYDIDIPAHSTNYYIPQVNGQASFYYGNVPPGIQVFGLTSHTHQLGVDFQIEKSTGGDPGDLLLQNQDWNNPPLKLFSPPVPFERGQGLRWTCGYTNPTDQDVTFGESAYDEMCFLWAYYFPSRGFQVCIPGRYGC